MLRPLVVLMVSALLTLAPAQSLAKPKREMALHFRKGQAHFKAERFAEAISEYQAAYAITPVPGLLYNIALAYHRQEKRAEALEYYRRYLVDEPNGPASNEAREHVATLSRELAPPQPPPAQPPPAQPPAVEPEPTSSPAPSPPPVTTPVTVTTPAAGPRRPTPWHAGAKAGFVVSTLSGDGWVELPRLGVIMGAFASYVPNDGISVQLELLYAQKGSALDGDSTILLHCLELPLVVRPTYRGWFAELGPYLGLALGSEIYGTSVNPVDVGLVFGAGYARKVGTGRVLFEARHERGLANVRSDGGLARNRTWSLTVGYSFL